MKNDLISESETQDKKFRYFILLCFLDFFVAFDLIFSPSYFLGILYFTLKVIGFAILLSFTNNILKERQEIVKSMKLIDKSVLKGKVFLFSLVGGIIMSLVFPIILITMLYELLLKEKTKLFHFSWLHRYKLLKISAFLFSQKAQKEIFLTAMAEWDEEIFEALKKDKDANLFMINVRNTYGFIMAMWQKSPLGDLLEYVRKIAS
jgi:hypothetical protein